MCGLYSHVKFFTQYLLDQIPASFRVYGLNYRPYILLRPSLDNLVLISIHMYSDGFVCNLN
jgi:hypothetical protein